MMNDHNREYRRDDPTSVIRCLVYYTKWLSSKDPEDLRLKQAKKMLKSGKGSVIVAEQFRLSESIMWKIVQEVESQGYLVSDE